MKRQTLFLLPALALFISLVLGGRNSSAQDSPAKTFPKPDPGLYRPIDKEIKIEPNLRKGTSESSSSYPPEPKVRIIPAPPIPEPASPEPDPGFESDPISREESAEPASPRPSLHKAQPVPDTPPPPVAVPSRDPIASQNPAPELPALSRNSPYMNGRVENPLPPAPGIYPPAASYPRSTPPVQPPFSVPVEPPAARLPQGLPEPVRPERIQPEISSPTLTQLRDEAHSLARQGIRYRLGHHTPRFGGLDSSGSVQYLLGRIGVPGVPRTTAGQFAWAQDHGPVHEFYQRPTVSELLESLAPGNLVFWGDINTGRLTHVMVYLGYDANRKRHFAFGTRAGSELGLNQNEVDLFALKLERERIIATGRIPGLHYSH